MKSLNLVRTLAIAALLIVGVTGCKKTPKNITNIPRNNARPISDEQGGIRLPGGQNGLTPGGNRLTDGDGTTGNGIGTKALTPEEIARLAGTQGERPPPGTENREMFANDAVYFDYDRSSVKSSEVSKVQRVAAYMKNSPTAYLRVEGNCDERGTEEYNRSLGERRALGVRELLIASGVPADRVTTLTNGEDKPADQGHDETAWGKNRRAEFIVITPDAGGIR